MRIASAVVCLALGGTLAFAQSEPPAKSAIPEPSTGVTVSPQDKGVQQPQGPTGPTDTTSGGAPPESPQGQTPPGMQAAPGGSSKTVVDPDVAKVPPPSKSAQPQQPQPVEPQTAQPQQPQPAQPQAAQPQQPEPTRPQAAQPQQPQPAQPQAAQQAPPPSATPTPSAVAILEKGVLTVPGANPDSQTAPAKYSKRTDEADQLSIAAYSLRHLTDEQRSQIFQALHKSMAISGDAPHVEPVVGAEINAQAMSDAVRPLPEMLRGLPELRGLAFVQENGKILIVSPTMHRVLAVLAP